MPSSPHLFLDVDGVLHGTHMKYGFERSVTIRERLPYADVHPALRPRRQSSGGELPDWVAARRGTPSHVTFNTPVRTSAKLREDIAALGVNVQMLTTWLEHDSVDDFFAQSGGASFEYSKLNFPGRRTDDPVGAVPLRWKVDQVHIKLAADPRPFIWVDDDETPTWRHEIAETYPDIPHLLIAPAYEVGITAVHMEQMREFVGEHGPA